VVNFLDAGPRGLPNNSAQGWTGTLTAKTRLSPQSDSSYFDLSLGKLLGLLHNLGFHSSDEFIDLLFNTGRNHFAVIEGHARAHRCAASGPERPSSRRSGESVSTGRRGSAFQNVDNTPALRHPANAERRAVTNAQSLIEIGLFQSRIEEGYGACSRPNYGSGARPTHPNLRGGACFRSP
jgi:hypothetical protein